ncbi:DUF4954 family protein [bacterium]|nr:DUF4954 family protein [bacterium]
MDLQKLIANFRDKFYLPNIVEELAENNLSTNELAKIVRPISKIEISKLESQGNRCLDWPKVFVEPVFTTDFIHNNYFSGRVFLGNYSGEEVRLFDNYYHPNGIYNSTLNDVFIDSNSLIKDNKLISRYYLSQDVIAVGNDLIYADKNTNFGNGITISVGSEVGGRDIPIYAEQDINYIGELITGQKEESIYNKYLDLVKDYADSVTSSFGIISAGAKVINNRKIFNSYIGYNAIIENTTKIANSTILSEPDERTHIQDGVIMEQTLCQWGVKVESMALVQKALLCEYSGVERHGKVQSSIIGPNTVIGEGEVTASILGPFIGFHHQSMLIGSLWIEGRGNVGYGANVGSNHTSKLPDQELFAGEGLFYGLGCNIKFPADYRKSAYSIIATGVTTLPQKVEFPFSLISHPFAPQPDIPPAYNEIIPGWVLSDNSYSVFRNEAKYLKRNKAKRLLNDFRVFRPEIITMIFHAYEVLTSVKRKKVYTDYDIPQLGKNFLSEENRLKGVEAYRIFLEFYTYRELHLKKESNLLTELIGSLGIVIAKADAKNEYKKAFKEIITMTINSKMKDHIRGAKIIDDYEEWHPDIEDDELIAKLRDELEKI